jgi:hypothetical protein
MPDRKISFRCRSEMADLTSAPRSTDILVRMRVRKPVGIEMIGRSADKNVRPPGRREMRPSEIEGARAIISFTLVATFRVLFPRQKFIQVHHGACQGNQRRRIGGVDRGRCSIPEHFDGTLRIGFQHAMLLVPESQQPIRLFGGGRAPKADVEKVRSSSGRIGQFGRDHLAERLGAFEEDRIIQQRERL